MSTLRIAHILPWVGLGGTEWATLRLAKAAATDGFESIFYCPHHEDGPFIEVLKREGFETAYYNQAEPSLRWPIRYLLASRALASDLRKRGVGVMHCSDLRAAYFTALAGRLAGTQVICHARLPHSNISRRDRIFLSPVQRFVFVSKDTWGNFGIQVPAKRGEVLYDGFTPPPSPGAIDREAARGGFGLAQNEFVFGMAARLSPQKDFESLILAAVTVIKTAPHCRFLIAGDFSENTAHKNHFDSLQALLKTTGMDRAFIFAGLQNKMESFYSAIDAFVLSTRWEGLPIAIMEAMSYNKPVVATKVNGIPELVSDYVTGLLVPKNSPEALARALLELVLKPELAARLGSAGYQLVVNDFSEEKYKASVVAFYRRLNAS